MLANYGYTSDQAGLYYDLQKTGVPSSMPLTAAENFLRESRAIVQTVFGGLRPKQKGDASRDELRDKLAQLKLSNQAVWDREHAREVRVVLLRPSNPLLQSSATVDGGAVQRQSTLPSACTPCRLQRYSATNTGGINTHTH